MSMLTPKPLSILIISDLHLAPEYPEINALFDMFLKKIAPSTEQLYILGDLFNYYLGDDAISDFQKTTAEKLKNLSLTHDIKIKILPGNRDVFLGQKFCELAHGALLPEVFTEDFTPPDSNHHSFKILYCHGDQLCTSDKKYQYYRKLIHLPWVRNLFLSLPIKFREKIALNIRKSSRRKFEKAQTYVDVEFNTAQEFAKKYEAKILIHGHTHHWVDQPEPPYLKRRIVNTDWKENSASYIQIDKSGMIEIKKFSPI